MIQYTRQALFLLRKQRPLACAIATTKQLGIFHFRGTRGGASTRNRLMTGASSPAGPAHPRASTSETFKTLLLNARSICNKTEDLDMLIETEKPTFIGITETWLKKSIPDSILMPRTFSVHRSDRTEKKKGGGVALMIASGWHSIEIPCAADHPKGLECNVVITRKESMPRTTSAIAFYTIYIAPGFNVATKISIQDHITSTLDFIKDRYPSSKTVLWGDTNQMPLSQLYVSNGLKQRVTLPTRNTSILDQIWSNLEFLNIRTMPPLGDGDHLIISSDLSISWTTAAPYTKKETYWVRPHTQSQQDACGAFLSAQDWSCITQAVDINEKNERLLQLLHDANEHFFPRKKVTTDGSSKKWATPKVLDLIKKRKTAHRNGRALECKALGLQVREAIAQEKSKLYNTRVKNLRFNNPRSWWKHVKSMGGMTSQRSNHPQFDIDLLNHHFINQGDHSPTVVTPAVDFIPYPVEVPMLLHDYEVSRMLNRVDPRKSQPLYDLPSFLLKNYHVELSAPVASIFNQSLLSGEMPEQWKTIEVLPLPKVKIPTRMDQYRAIARVPVLLKVLDVFAATVLRLQMRGKVDRRQFGGQPGISCGHHLVQLLNTIHTALNARKTVRLQTLDLAKSYDSVRHDLLIPKLSSINLHPQILNWVISLLRSLLQVVRLTGSRTTSSPLQITRGIPQGTSLAPTLFTVFTNDMPPDTNHQCWVDDITTLGMGDDITDATAQSQDHLDSISIWTETNGLLINAEKSQSIVFTPNTDPRAPIPDVNVNGANIEDKKEVKILGITITNDLRWDKHINSITSKANSRLYFLTTIAKSIPAATKDLCIIYTSFVRPILEHASSAWGLTINATNNGRIERVQRKAVKRITRDWNEEYEDTLNLLDLKSLEDRRAETGTKLARAMIADGRFRDLFPPTQNCISHRNTRRSQNLCNIRHRTERFRRSPIPVLTRLYNDHLNSQ